MDEPAPQLNDKDQVSSYDEPTGTAPSSPLPHLRSIEGGGQSTEPRRGHLKAVGDGQPSRDDIIEGEKNPDGPAHKHENTAGKGYTGEGSLGAKSSNKRFSLSRRKKWGIGIGSGLIGGGIIALLLLLLPALRLDGYLAGIDNLVFAAANNAVSNRIDNLFERYLGSRILTIQKCGNKVTNSCKNDYSQAGIAKSLFNTWQDARIEDQLFQKLGFEVQSLKRPINGQRFKIIATDPRWGDAVGEELKFENGNLVLGKFEGGPRIFGQELNKFLSEQTRWSEVMQRVSVRKYLVRKHGTKFWCLFACEQKDAIDNAKISATTKLKLKLIERVVYPFSTKYGLILKCLTTGDASQCNPNDLDAIGVDESALSQKDIADLQKVANNPDQAVSQYIIEQILIKTGVDEVTAKEVTGTIPIAGQIYLGLSAVDTLEQAKNFIANGELGKIAASITAAQYVEYYTTMRSADDEIKSGSVPLDEVGALNSQFDYNNQPAEQSLVYQAYNNTKPAARAVSSSSLISSILGNSKVLADTTSPPYTCSNGQPIPAGQLVCPEKTLNQRSFKIENYFKDASWIDSLFTPYEACYGIPTPIGCGGIRPSTDVHELLKTTNWLINNTLGSIMSGILGTLKAIPGLGYLMGQLTAATANIINDLFKEVFPLPIQPTSPGRDRYDGLEAGGEIAASEFNKGGYTASGQPYGLGGQLLTNQQQSDASQAYLDQQNYDNNHGSLIDRFANINNPGSLLSRFVAVMPTSWNQFSANVFSFITNPFKNFGAIWHPAYAATDTAAINAFGVPRFGYTANDSTFNADPSIYTPQYCQQLEQKWEATKTQDPITGIDEYSTTNPCLLEQVSVEAASAAFTGNDSLGQ